MKYQVTYQCKWCGADFFLDQGDPEPDEDIDMCWACIDLLFRD